METFIALTYILLAVALHFMTTPMHSYILWVIPQIGLLFIGLFKLYENNHNKR